MTAAPLWSPSPADAQQAPGPDPWAWWQWLLWVLWSVGTCCAATAACVLVAFGASTSCSEDPSVAHLREGQQGFLMILAVAVAVPLCALLVGRRQHRGRWCTASVIAAGPSLVFLAVLSSVEDFRGSFCF